MVPHTSVLFDVVSCIRPSLGPCPSIIIVLSVRATIHSLSPRSFSTDALLAVESGAHCHCLERLRGAGMGL
jgi:hypothetical protein